MKGILAACLLLIMSCAGKGEEGKEPVNGGTETGNSATLYITTADHTRLFEALEVPVGGASTASASVITLDTDTKFQTVQGFGAALTGASCYNLLQMGADARHAFLKELFDPKEGLGISLVRVSIGASDFSVDEEFTWCDTEGIENFAVAREDKEYLFPILKEVYSINPDLQIIASPWSCPRWMKRVSVTNDQPYLSWTSGSLMPEYYEDYATYFVRWIQTMEAEGFNIHAITIQNEPLNKGNSMSLYMTWQEQRDFIKQALGPAFRDAGIKAKILLFDHNYNYDGIADQKDYPLNILADADAAQYVAGTAWHNYNGSVTELDRIQKQAPDKEIYFTEASIGTWNYDFSKCLTADFSSIFLETLKRGNRGVTLWNFMLDENRKPYRPGGCSTCYGVVTISSASHAVIDRTTHYYNIAHASKAVKTGAVRIGLKGNLPSGISCVAFQNPDGTYAALLCNSGDSPQQIVLRKSAGVAFAIPAKSIASVVWKD